MSTEATTKKMTAEEFYEWSHLPENENKWHELVRGEIIALPAPTKPHGVVCGNIVWVLSSYVRRRDKGYVTSNDAGVLLERAPDTVRGPDVAVYEDAQAFDELHPKYGEVPPRLAVEVLSPNDRADRMNRKVADYLRGGVAMVWLVDLESRSVAVYRPDQGLRLVDEAGELSGELVLPDLRCRVADFFYVAGQQPPKPARLPRKRRR